MPNPELLPCPFCGSTLLGKQEGERRADGIAGEPAKIICADCDARIFAHSIDKAIAAWNARPAQATEGLREAVEAIAKEADAAMHGDERHLRDMMELIADKLTALSALAPSKIAPSEPL